MAVLARREADGILLGGQLQLTISGAKEHEQLEDRQEVLVNNSIRPEPSLPAIACRMTTEVPELWDHGDISAPRGGSEMRSRCKRTSADSSSLSRHTAM